jgi:hydrogenase assembly chaperone HypC/HupF
MCLTIPKKVIAVQKKQAKVISQSGTSWVKTNLIKSVKKGDWLLIQADLAIDKITSTQANKILKLIYE